MPVRLPSRKICVSTAIVGSPNASFNTTLAVLRPTPKATLQVPLDQPVPRRHAGRSRYATRQKRSSLVLNRPMVRIWLAMPSTPSAIIPAGVSAAANRPLVALFTQHRLPEPTTPPQQEAYRGWKNQALFSGPAAFAKGGQNNDESRQASFAWHGQAFSTSVIS